MRKKYIDCKTLIAVSLQHICAMFASTILVPGLINAQIGYTVLSPQTALVASGLGTLIYLIITSGKSPAYLSSAFAFVTPLVYAYGTSGLDGMLSGVIAVGVFYIIIALLVFIYGKEWLNFLFPPIVVGTLIIIIGISLMQNSLSSIGLNISGIVNLNLFIIAMTSIIITLLSLKFGNQFIKSIPFLIGIIAGCIVSYFYDLFDLSYINEVSFITKPNFIILFKDFNLDFSALIYVIPIVIATIPEHIGSHLVLGNMINKDLTKNPGISKTLFGNGLSIMTAGIIGAPVNSIYGENISVVGITKVTSPLVIVLTAIFAISISFLGQITYIINSIPLVVLSSVGIILYFFIVYNGYITLKNSNINLLKLRNILIIVGMMLIGLKFGNDILDMMKVSLNISNLILAALYGVILNIFLPGK